MEDYKQLFFKKRKSPRISGYDYASHNYYFVTICTHNKKCIFGKPNHLNEMGKAAEQCLLSIPRFYSQVSVDKYVVMPNHVHMILIFHNISNECIPDLSRVVGQYKMSVTKKIHFLSPNEEIWQRSFHDHVIRNQKSYEKIWMYIENNPQKWEEDCFYT